MDLENIFDRIEDYRNEVIQIQSALTCRVAMGPENGGTGEHEKAGFVKGLLEELDPDVLEEFPNTKLVILGIGDMEWDLKKQSENLGIQDKVILRTEFVSEEERILHYAAADSVVLPSIYEPFGIACTESMSMAKPTVVGARGTNGFREQITPNGNKKCGIHINPHDSNDIAWGIKQVLQLDDKGKSMGKNARKRVIENFSWESATKRLLDIYEEFL